VIAVSAFVMMDCALNAYQGPVRALISDLLPADRHGEANSLLASTTGASWLLGYGVGSLNLVRIFPVFSSEFQAVSAMAATYMALFGLLPLGFLVEPAQLDGHPAGGQRPPRTRSWVSVMARSLPEATAAFTALPSSIMPAFRVQFGTFWAWFAFKMFATEWMGTAVFLGQPAAEPGSPARERFEAGVRWANLSLMVMSGVFCASSLLQPAASRALGPKAVWQVGLVVLTASLSAMCLVSGKVASMFLFAILGLPFSTAFSIPWTLVTQVASTAPGSSGRITAGFNLSQCLPSFALAFLSGPLIALSGRDTVVPVLVAGGAGAAAAAFSLMHLEIPAGFEPMSGDDDQDGDDEGDEERREEAAAEVLGSPHHSTQPLEIAPP